MILIREGNELKIFEYRVDQAYLERQVERRKRLGKFVTRISQGKVLRKGDLNQNLEEELP